MIPPRIPTGEAARLADLRALSVLDTDPEPRFDDLVRIAARLAETPIAALSLVDSDRLWFKARTGLRQSQTPRAGCRTGSSTP